MYRLICKVVIFSSLLTKLVITNSRNLLAPSPKPSQPVVLSPKERHWINTTKDKMMNKDIDRATVSTEDTETETHILSNFRDRKYSSYDSRIVGSFMDHKADFIREEAAQQKLEKFYHLSSAQITTLLDYTGDGYRIMNNALRDNHGEIDNLPFNLKQEARILESAIKSISKYQKNTSRHCLDCHTLYRSQDVRRTTLRYINGTSTVSSNSVTIKFNHFISTSYTPENAQDYPTQGPIEGTTKVLFIIDIDPEADEYIGADLTGLSLYKGDPNILEGDWVNENEALLLPQTEFEFIRLIIPDDSESDKRIQVRLRYIGVNNNIPNVALNKEYGKVVFTMNKSHLEKLMKGEVRYINFYDVGIDWDWSNFDKEFMYLHYRLGATMSILKRKWPERIEFDIDNERGPPRHRIHAEWKMIVYENNRVRIQNYNDLQHPHDDSVIASAGKYSLAKKRDPKDGRKRYLTFEKTVDCQSGIVDCNFVLQEQAGQYKRIIFGI